MWLRLLAGAECVQPMVEIATGRWLWVARWGWLWYAEASHFAFKRQGNTPKPCTPKRHTLPTTAAVLRQEL